MEDVKHGANPVVNQVRYPVYLRMADGRVYAVDWRDIEEAMHRNPTARTVPGDDLNELMLTADDCVWLWTQGVTP